MCYVKEFCHLIKYKMTFKTSYYQRILSFINCKLNNHSKSITLLRSFQAYYMLNIWILPYIKKTKSIRNYFEKYKSKPVVRTGVHSCSPVAPHKRVRLLFVIDKGFAALSPLAEELSRDDFPFASERMTNFIMFFFYFS